MSKKEAIEVKQIMVNMALPQSEGKDGDILYENFRKRVARKSRERNDAVKNPIQLILAFRLVMLNVQNGFLVVKDSFVSLKDPEDDKVEIGFKAEIQTIFGNAWLYVYKRQQAYLEFALKASELKRIITNMALPQSKGKAGDVLYANFQKRVARKSHERNDEKKNPIQLILAFRLVMLDIQNGFLVVKDSFVSLKDPENDKVEIGFKAEIQTIFGNAWLYVYERQQAYLEIM